MGVNKISFFIFFIIFLWVAIEIDAYYKLKKRLNTDSEKIFQETREICKKFYSHEYDCDALYRNF